MQRPAIWLDPPEVPQPVPTDRPGSLGPHPRSTLVAMNAEVATLAARPLPALVTNALASTRSLVVASAGEGLPT